MVHVVSRVLFAIIFFISGIATFAQAATGPVTGSAAGAGVPGAPPLPPAAVGFRNLDPDEKALLASLPPKLQEHPAVVYLMIDYPDWNYRDYLWECHQGRNHGPKMPKANRLEKAGIARIINPEIQAEDMFLTQFARIFGESFDISLGNGETLTAYDDKKKLKKSLIKCVGAAIINRTCRVGQSSSTGRVYLSIDLAVPEDDYRLIVYFTRSTTSNNPLFNLTLSKAGSSLVFFDKETGKYQVPDPKCLAFFPGDIDAVDFLVKRLMNRSSRGTPGRRRVGVKAVDTTPKKTPGRSGDTRPLTFVYNPVLAWDNHSFDEHMSDAKHQARLAAAGYMPKDLPGLCAQMEGIVRTYPWLASPHWYLAGLGTQTKASFAEIESFMVPIYRRNIDSATGALILEGLPVLFLTLSPDRDAAGVSFYTIRTALMPDMIASKLSSQPQNVRENIRAMTKVIPVEEAMAFGTERFPFKVALDRRGDARKQQIKDDYERELAAVEAYQKKAADEKAAILAAAVARKKENKRIEKEREHEAARRKESEAVRKAAANKKKREKKEREKLVATVLQSAKDKYMRSGQDLEVMLAVIDEEVVDAELVTFVKAKLRSWVAKREKKAMAEIPKKAAFKLPKPLGKKTKIKKTKSSAVKQKSKAAKKAQRAREDQEERLLAQAIADNASAGMGLRPARKPRRRCNAKSCGVVAPGEVPVEEPRSPSPPLPVRPMSQRMRVLHADLAAWAKVLPGGAVPGGSPGLPVVPVFTFTLPTTGVQAFDFSSSPPVAAPVLPVASKKPPVFNFGGSPPSVPFRPAPDVAPFVFDFSSPAPVASSSDPVSTDLADLDKT